MAEKSILEKLQLKPGRKMLILNAPPAYLIHAGVVPETAILTTEKQPAQIVQAFINSRKELETEFLSLTALVEPGGMLWLTYPKLTSKLKSDINRDSINAYAQENGWTGIAMISIDEDWSALRLKPIE